jgi:hypothetical protein
MSGEKVAFEKKAEEKIEGRERSKIDWPYGDLEDAEQLAKAVHDNAGTSCSVEQLAGYMNQSAGGGGFRVRITTAKTFGLIENPRGQIVLSEIGKRIVDPLQERAARVDAFMKVPLYSAIYDKFKRNVLPPRAALQREMQTLGVVETQTDRARQAFERSAERAGFFAHGRDRLVMPVIKEGQPNEKPKNGETRERSGSGGGGNGVGYDPLIQGLLNRLPQPGTDWSAEDRATWARALFTNFELVYSGQGNKKITITVD